MHLKDLRWNSVDCIHLAQNRGQWRALILKLNSGFLKMQGISSLGDHLLKRGFASWSYGFEKGRKCSS
jgi:hypothetical protein